jgi:hypothetical protein
LTALYQNTSMNDYFKDANGTTAVLSVTPGLQPGVLYNVAGRDFPIGPWAPYVYKDPALYSFVTTGSTVNGTTFTAGTVTSGTVRDGLILWSSPGGSGLITNGPVLSGCTGGGGSGTVCTISISQSSKSGNYRGSVARGCTWTNGGAGVSNWNCDLRYPNNATTAAFDHFEFGAVGGHTSSIIRVTASDNGMPTLSIKNSHFIVDAQTYQQTIVSAVVGVKSNLIFEDNEGDGGEVATPTGGLPATMAFPEQTQLINWPSGNNGTGRANAFTVSFKRNWIHDWAGNPVKLPAGASDQIIQANVYYRLHMNDGDSGVWPAPGATGLHGASIQFDTTLLGTEGWVKRYNDNVIVPYGFRHGVITAPFAVLGGAGSAITMNYDQRLSTAFMNRDNQGAAYAPSEVWIDPFRIGYMKEIILKNNYVSTLGLGPGGCYNVGADMSRNYTTSIAPLVGTGTSTLTISGFTGAAGASVIYPGQAVSANLGSQTQRWTASLADNGNGTSTMTISSVQIPITGNLVTLPAGTQVVALRMVDTQTSPTLTVSGTGNGPYIVTNGTGSGETRAAQSFRQAYRIKPFGYPGTTATGGSTPANYNGDYIVGGEVTVSPPGQNLSSISPLIGNSATIDTDVVGNYDVITGTELVPDGDDLSSGSCPGTGLP